MNIIASSKEGRHAEIARVLEGFDYPAILLNAHYEILAVNSLYQQAFGELRFAGTPHYCYQVSHGYDKPCDQAGESCPLNRVKDSGGKERVLHIHQTRNGTEHIEIDMLPIHNQESEITFFVEVMKPIPLASGHRKQRTMVGRSPAFLRMLDRISKVSKSDASVLLLGDTGTGKELAARAIHESSARSNQPLITLECSGLTDNLFESELFGHVKGAFTGAHSAKKGLVELANGGTLFLDEIADVPLSMQVKLLRLLENRTFRAIGGTEEKTSDFRLVCATHKNIGQLIREERFRGDLYHRINVFPVRLPSLRERIEDLPVIANSLLSQLAPERTIRLTESALALIARQPLTGNIRELRNILNRAVVLEAGSTLDHRVIAECLDVESAIIGATASISAAPSSSVPSSAVPSNAVHSPPAMSAGWTDLKTLESTYIQRMHTAFGGDLNRMAEVLGISMRSLYRKLKAARE